MEDIELVIKIPKEKYNEYKRIGDSRDILFEAIRNGTPIDKYEPCITMSRVFANSLTYVKILKDENEELKNKINKIINEINHTGAYELKMHGQTDFLSGINYCLDTIKKNGLTVIEADKESKE